MAINFTCPYVWEGQLMHIDGWFFSDLINCKGNEEWKPLGINNVVKNVYFLQGLKLKLF